MFFPRISLCLIMISAALVLSSAPVKTVEAQTRKRPQPQKVTTYSCPMHPDYKSKKPGACPKCGMTLRPVETPSPTPTPSPATEKPATEKLNIPDVEVVNQEGQKIKFYTDLVKDRVVAINFIFTTCTTICPPLGATFARVQKDLGERAGRDVQMISISVDPVTDTPERLKAWGEKFHAARGWTFVTGAKPQMDELLRALGAATASPQDHSPMVLIGNDARGEWTRTYGLAPSRQLVELIDKAAAGGSEH